MQIEKAVYSALAGSGALRALVGDKIFAVKISQDTRLPCITYRRSSGVPDMTLTGYQSEQVSLSVDSWAVDSGSARAIAWEIRGALAAAGFIFNSDRDDFNENYCRVSTSFTGQQKGGFSICR